MAEQLIMNDVSNIYLDGKEVYDIYDYSPSIRRIWPKEDKPSPLRKNINVYFDVSSITNPDVEVVGDETTITFPSPRTITFAYNNTALPEGKTKIVILGAEVHVTTSTLASIYYWKLPLTITSGSNITDISDTSTYIKITEDTGGETKTMLGQYVGTELFLIGIVC